MAYNPCGRAVEWGRYPYTTKARVHNSPDAPLVDLVWYVTDLDFLGITSLVNQRKNDSDVLGELVTGEVPTQFPPPYNGLEKIPGMNGQHICGEEFFETGQPWPVTTPPTEYDTDGIPTCCGRNPVGNAAIGLRPSAVVTFTYPTVTTQVNLGLRPAALVTYLPAVHPAVLLGLRPAALVTFGASLSHTCAGATDLDLPGHWVLENSQFAPTGQLWARAPATTGAEFYLKAFGTTPQAGQLFFGTSCEDLEAITTEVGSDSCETGTAPGDGFVFMLLSADLILPGTGEWEFGAGACP